MLPADLSISTSHDHMTLLPSSFYGERCYGTIYATSKLIIIIRNKFCYVLMYVLYAFLFLCSFKERGARNTLELLSPVRNI